jgi:hypothetical protein
MCVCVYIYIYIYIYIYTVFHTSEDATSDKQIQLARYFCGFKILRLLLVLKRQDKETFREQNASYGAENAVSKPAVTIRDYYRQTTINCQKANNTTTMLHSQN